MIRLKKKKRNNIKYPKGILIASLLLFALIILRLAQLSLATEIDGTNLKELASKRTTRTDTILAKRGTIYSSDGETLAQNVSSYKIIAYLDEKRTTNPKKPQHVVDKEKTAKALSPILGIEEEKLLEYLSKENVYQTEFGSKGKGLTELTKQKIDDLNLPGIDFIESYKRYYPKGQFASYTLGYAKTTSEEENISVGEMGIEKEYDNILKGEDGYINSEYVSFTPEDEIEGGFVLVAKKDEKIVGVLRCSLFWQSIPFLDLIFLEENFRRLGIGSAMIKKWEDDMVKLGFTHVMTSTQANETAYVFYEKLGYKKGLCPNAEKLYEEI